MKLRYWSYNTPFVYPFTISYGTKTHQPSLVVELEHLGLKGYGEAPAISYYQVTVEGMIEVLERKKTFIEKYAFTDPGRYWHYLHHLLPGQHFLICALDMAAWDLYGKMRKQPLYRLWGYDVSKAPLTDYTIGIDTIDRMLQKMRDKPWPIYKIKLGTKEDLRIVEAMREEAPEATIRVDANAGWTVDDALELLGPLKALDVELIEQPLAKYDFDGMKLLYEKAELPLFADESCVLEQDVVKCVERFDGINIKLTKCGGITPARRMIAQARQLGLQVMIGSMNETSIGSAAIAHLMPAADYADADGPLLLKEDLATGLRYDNGQIFMTDAPGLGIDFHF